VLLKTGLTVCGICTETVARGGAMLRCAHCAHACCSECARRFFAEAPLAPASCMHPDCRKRLSAANLLEAFSEAYVHTVRGARARS
jgi:hypothetical protein